MINNKLLSFTGTNEKLFIAKCSLLSKKSRNIFLNSFTPYCFTFFSSVIYASFSAFASLLSRNFLPAKMPATHTAARITILNKVVNNVLKNISLPLFLKNLIMNEVIAIRRTCGKLITAFILSVSIMTLYPNIGYFMRFHGL